VNDEKAARETRGSTRRLPLRSLALTVGLVLVAAFAGWRLTEQHVRSASVTPSPANATAAPFVASGQTQCRMPVVVMLESGPPGQGQTGTGFLDTGTGQYTADPTASVAGLPGGAFAGTVGKPPSPSTPVFYSESLHRWLPVEGSNVSPDGASYVWARLLPVGSNFSNFRKSELHRYDVASAVDRTLWTYPGTIGVHHWDASGILVDTVPPTGGQLIEWLINPTTGVAARQAPAVNIGPPLQQLSGDPLEGGGFNVGNVPGAEFHGHQIYRIGSRDPGSPQLIVYETSPGQRVIIYRGSQGDATKFDPFYGWGDAAGVWFTDYGGQVLWRWEPATGLRKITLVGLPPLLPGPNSGAYVRPAGVCVPV